MSKKIMQDYEIILRMIKKRYGEKTSENVRRSALAHYAEFEKTVNTVKNGIEKFHLTYIAERCAMYLALKEKFPTVAYSWIDRAVEIKSSKMQKSMDKLTRLPGGKYVFIKLCCSVSQSMFGEKAGFKQRLREKNSETLAFDMLECPYCKYCKTFGCEELTRSFCDSDEYAYKELKNIDFIRSKTLGTGGDCCDFCYKVK